VVPENVPQIAGTICWFPEVSRKVQE